MSVDSVFLHWVSLTVMDEYANHEVLGMVVGRFMGVFYADERMIGSRYPECLQVAINVLIRLFRRVGLINNFTESKTMTCHPGAIGKGISEEAFSWRSKEDRGPI